MVKCLKCGNRLNNDQKFCTKCGSKIEEIKKAKLSPEVLAQIDILQKKISNDNLNNSLYIKLGDIYFENEMYNEAILEYQKSFTIDNKNFDPIFKTAETYRKLNNNSKAEQLYQKALEIDPKSQEAKINLFWSCFYQNKFDEIVKLSFDIDDEYKTLEFHIAMKTVYITLNNIEEAFKEMKLINQLDSDNINNLRDIAEYHSDIDNDKSIEFYNRILSVDPNDIDSIFVIGKDFCYKKNYKKTIELFENNLSNFSFEQLSIIYIYLSFSYLKMDNIDEAIDMINNINISNISLITSIDKEIIAKTLLGLSDSCVKRNNYDSAINYLENAIRFDPKNQEFINRLSEINEIKRSYSKKIKKMKLRKLNLSFATIIIISILIFAVIKFLNIREDNLAWEKAKTTNTISSYEKYLSIYSEGKYKNQASESIQQLNEELLKNANMIFVQGGTFQMGSSDGGSLEKPVHSVTISDFYICKYEVTQKEWQEVIGSNPSYFKGDNLPVEGVTWYDAVEFCNKKSIKEGLQPFYTIIKNRKDRNNKSNYDNLKWLVTCDFSKNGYHLPTEAQWEYSCKGGVRTAEYKYSGSNMIDDVAWYKINSGSKTHSVGKKKANELGLYDMSGNVYEWCWDWDGYYNSNSQIDPKGNPSGSYRVCRGGSWDHKASNCRMTERICYMYSTNDSYNLGVRLVRSQIN